MFYNVVYQRMTITGQPERVRAVMDSIRGQECSANDLFDLNSIVEMPEPLKALMGLTDHDVVHDVVYEFYGPDAWRGLNRQVVEARDGCLAKTGFVNWREWAFEHWGADSNVSDVVECEPGVLRFCSELSPIWRAMRVLSAKFKDVEILLEFVDSGRVFLGFSIFVEGQEDRFMMEWCSAEARELRRRLDCIDDAVDEGDDLDVPNEYIN